MKKPLNSLFWHFTKQHLKDKHYLKDIDYIAENLDVDYISIATLEGIVLGNTEQCHGFLKEITHVTSICKVRSSVFVHLNEMVMCNL